MEKTKLKEINANYIRKFTDIKIKNICIELGLEIDYQNIMSGTASAEKIERVKKEVEKRIEQLND